jgi:hypothetical protein
MAATEAFSGPSIAGREGSASMPARPYSAYVPVQEIPNAPKPVQMPLATYPAIRQPTRQQFGKA